MVKFEGDIRYCKDGYLVTHDKWKLEASHIMDSCLNNWGRLKSFDAVVFDEGQFYPTLPEVAERLADSGVDVAVTGLNSAFYRNGFPPIMELYSKAEEIVFLKTPCGNCVSKDGYFTMQRDGAPSERSLEDFACYRPELIGGPEMYVVLCRACYLQKLKPENG